jgi:hypothetical protein
VSDQNSQGDKLIEMHEMRGFHLHVAYMMHMIVAATRGLAAETGDLDSSQSGEQGKINEFASFSYFMP